MKVKNAFITGVVFAFVMTLLIAWSATGLTSFRQTLLPDAGPDWYFWKLPAVSIMATITMWLFYGVHQLACWYLIWKLQHEKRALRSENLGKYNMALLIVNGVCFPSCIFFRHASSTTGLPNSYRCPRRSTR